MQIPSNNEELRTKTSASLSPRNTHGLQTQHLSKHRSLLCIKHNKNSRPRLLNPGIHRWFYVNGYNHYIIKGKEFSSLKDGGKIW
jgi:hypothetical protein